MNLLIKIISISSILCIIFGFGSPDCRCSDRELLNVWHIPQNEEPPSVTMRNPLHPCEGDQFVYIYCGGYPQGTIWSGTLYYRLAGTEIWEDVSFNFDSNQGANEFWIANFPNSTYLEGETVQYYLALTGDSAIHEDTFIYGTDSTSTGTTDESEAQNSPFEFTLCGSNPTPEPTGTTPPEMLNVWHIPSNTEPTSETTMRLPLYPEETSTTMAIFCGAHPAGSSATGGTFYWRTNDSTDWTAVPFIFNSQQENNDYWVSETNISSLVTGDDFFYYLKMISDNTGLADTFIYGDDDHSNKTLDENVAQTNAFHFQIGNVPTPNPSATPTPLPLLNVWHLPENEEPETVTMREPLYPGENDDTVYIYCGAYPPNNAASGGLLYWKVTGETDWSEENFVFNTQSAGNDYWLATADISSITSGTQIQYYFRMWGNPEDYTVTFIYGDDSHSNVTYDELKAQTHPYSFTIGSVPTPNPTPTGTQKPLINTWHLPTVEEPSGTTMRNPVNPTESNDLVEIYCGGYPQDVVWGGVLYWKSTLESDWQNDILDWYVNEGANVYWNAQINNQNYTPGTTVQYYLAIYGDPDFVSTTFIFWNGVSSDTSYDEDTAKTQPFTYEVGWGSSTPTPTFTPTPPNQTPTPTPSITSTPILTPSPTPTSQITLGVDLYMPSTLFHSGDTCFCTAHVNNPGNIIDEAFLFVLLDVGIGEYWFWPHWLQYPPSIDYQSITVPTGSTPYEILDSFSWPTGTGSAENIKFIGALVDKDMTQIIGEPDELTFGWQSE